MADPGESQSPHDGQPVGARAVTLRARIAAVASLAVALAVIVVAVSLYIAVRSDLRGQIDQSLSERAQIFTSAAALLPDRAGPGLGPGRPPQGTRARRFPAAVQPARFGGASGYVQLVSRKGKIDVPGGQGSSPTIPLSSVDRRIAARGSGRSLNDRTVKGTHLRVLTIGIDSSRVSGAVMILARSARSITS